MVKRDKFGKFVKGGHPVSEFKKGHKFGKRFKKGHTPWCKGKKVPQTTGHKHHNWNGGKTIINGYVHIKKPSHPFHNKQNYVLRSHLVMEKHLGRYLKPGEIIHHINGIKIDDRIKNLKLFPNVSAHIKFHKPS